MMPSGPSTSIGGSHSASAALLKSNYGNLGAQGGPQGAYSSVRPQYDTNLLGNAQNISSGLSKSLVNGGLNSGCSYSGIFQHGGRNTEPEFDVHSIASNDVAFTQPPASFAQPNRGNPGSCSQAQMQHPLSSSGNQVLPDQQQSQAQQLEKQKFHYGHQFRPQFSHQHLHQLHPQQQPYQASQCEFGDVGVNLDPQMINDRNCLQKQLQLSQQRQVGRGIAPVNIQANHLEKQLFLQQQQQQPCQQYLNMSRQSPDVSAALLNISQQQHMLELLELPQQKQKQQLLNATQQRPQPQPLFQQQNLPAKLVYEPGMCVRRLYQYMNQQKHRPNVWSLQLWNEYFFCI